MPSRGKICNVGSKNHAYMAAFLAYDHMVFIYGCSLLINYNFLKLFMIIKYAIGIDPGTRTGLAVRETDSGKFIDVRTLDIFEAIGAVKHYYDNGGCFVFIENPMLRKWFGPSGRERLQGAGSVKRDFRIWKTQLKKYGIPYKDIAPAQVVALPPQYVAQQWSGRTSEHARDAMSLALRDPELFTKK